LRGRSAFVLLLLSSACSPGVITPHQSGTTDAGSPPAEDVAPIRDDAAEPPAADAGFDPIDAGFPPVDAGHQPVDAGPMFTAPDRLSETGLYADTATGAFAPGVMAFKPRYELWSDDAAKRRWLWLPDREQIDTSDMDQWRFPVGTKAWKEFTRDGVRIETRLIEKASETQWLMIAYEWNAAQTEAFALPDGGADRAGTDHDIPSEMDCRSCHDGIEDRLAGVSAIQLNHDGTGVTFEMLAQSGTLTATTSNKLAPPGDALVSDTLGYLHANCGNCHNPLNVGRRPDGPQLVLWLDSDSLEAPEDTPTYRTTIERRTILAPLDGTTARKLVATGSSAESLLWIRMDRRGENTGAMPPLGSEVVHDVGTASVAAWIDQLSR